MAKQRTFVEETQESPETSQQESPEITLKETQKRIYKGDIRIESDLFKLHVAKMKKDMDNNKDNPNLVDMEHCHIWRTYDSDGKPQQYCSPIGGHFHEITYEEDANGAVKVTNVSPPLTWGAKKIKGRFKKVAVPLPEHLMDYHTHKTEYIESHKVQTRQQNPIAANIIAADAQKVAPVSGVIG